MKKVIVIIFALSLFFMFASCGGKDAQVADTASLGSTGQTEIASAAEAEAVSTAAEQATAAESVQPTEATAKTYTQVIYNQPVAEQASEVESSSQNQSQVQYLQQSTDSQPVQQESVVQSFTQPAQLVSPAAVSEGVTIEGGGYTVEVVSAKVDKDYSGNDVVAVKFRFTNNNSDSVSFGDVIDVSVSQNGRTLKDDGIMFDGSSFDGCAFNFRTPMSNGSSISVVYAYNYSSSDPVDVSVKIYNDFLNRKVLGSGSCTLNLQ